MKSSEIREETSDATINIVLDTLKKEKQAIVFVNTKRGAEALAERIASKIKEVPGKETLLLADKAEKTLSSPTKQCRRLGKILRKSVAFHHSGLHYEQRDIVETGFRERNVRVICATPTLAAGVDLPAYRVVIRDLKRYSGGWGMQGIPVLEYEQMAGRAGRPSFDKEGEAVCIANNVGEREEIWEQYVNGLPEDILSKLAVEPVLRTYVLALVATGYAGSFKELMGFMKNTFYAHQYKELSRLKQVLKSTINSLEEWEFIQTNKEAEDDFVSADKIKKDEDFLLKPTKPGERAAELYPDPLTANYLLKCMRKAASEKHNAFGLLQMISWTLEMRPLIRSRQKDIPLIDEKLVLESEKLLAEEPSSFSDEYDEFIDSVKTALVLEAWIEETTEEQLLEKYGVTPGEMNAKIERSDWLLYSCFELSKLQGFRKVSNEILKIRVRVKSGAKEELLPLLKLKNVGRVRARKLYTNKIKDLGDVKKASITLLAELIGKNVALDVKKQVGQDLSNEKIVVKKNKRKGQVSLGDY